MGTNMQQSQYNVLVATIISASPTIVTYRTYTDVFNKTGKKHTFFNTQPTAEQPAVNTAELIPGETYIILCRKQGDLWSWIDATKFDSPFNAE